MLLRMTTRLLAVAALVLGTGVIGLAAPAFACACGGVATPGGVGAHVADETALIGWDGTQETIVMRLGLQSGGDKAALIVPTPAPATVSAGSRDTFTELTRLTAPSIVVDKNWELGGGFGGADTAGAPGGPTVLGRVDLGPLEATTLTGGDLSGVRQWLQENGYVMRPEVIATLQPYLDDKWAFVAMRLTGDKPLTGELDPVRLTFAADRPVYPMRMSSAATQVQTVHLYVLGPHRIERNDADSATQTVAVSFAGRVSDPTDPELARLSADGHDYLTEMRVVIPRPERITHDFGFADAPDDTPYREVVHRTETVHVLGSDAGVVLAVLALLILLFVVVLVVVWLIRRARRR
ncbi:DUF2330 domain-containing protein [Nocardia jejuensis]|uniref:DUF2330 domain-containing protein n=1 Tax=Nocardia jejuensis TaxID=328049 RepID=UPI000830D8BE|nr:DUF2330 domain-containing protein [Nocardia jejuensis]